MFTFVGFSIYLLLKKNPNESRSILSHANTLIKYMPIDKNTSDLISPIFEFTKIKNDINNYGNGPSFSTDQQTPQMKRMLNSGKSNKRCVSETKKKYVCFSTRMEMRKMPTPIKSYF